jgi:RNA polymerase sigma factor (sigma-70 family)
MSVVPARGHVASDSTLVARIAAGDDRALGTLYDRYGATVYSLACAMIGDAKTAEEVVAAVFAQAWKERRSLAKTRASALAWLTSQTRCRAVEERKRLGRATPAVPRFVRKPEDRRGTAGPVDPSKMAVTAALAALPETQRRAIELTMLGGLTTKEVADQLELPERAAHDCVRSAMQTLRAALAPREATFDRTMATHV